MEAILLKAKIQGIKNLENEIVLEFYNNVIKKQIKTGTNNVKAIYGYNGAGKTALMSAFFINKNLFSIPNYLLQASTVINLRNLINIKTKQFKISLTFAVSFDENSKPMIYRHEYCLKPVGQGISMTFECLSLFNGLSLSDDKAYEPIYTIENGAITQCIETIENDPVFFISKGELLHSPFLFPYYALMNADHPNKQFSPKWENAINALMLFENSLLVHLQSEDIHPTSWTEMKRGITLCEQSEMMFESDSTQSPVFNPFDKDIVQKKDFSKYEEQINKLTYFIRLFKPNLIRIEIQRKQDKSSYLCEKLFVYKDYKISSEFESTGIKKIIKLFNLLKACAEGCIVFIDELDENINSIYLTKLITFFQEYGKGQLCFTSQNLEPMNVLTKHKYAIDFLTVDQRIVPWVTNGNYSPINQYKEGMTDGSPYNIAAEDFISCFPSEVK